MNGISRLLHAIALCCILLPATAQAQVIDRSTEESDFQVRTGFSIGKQVLNGLHITWSEELRLKKSLREIDRIYSVLAISYDILPWLRAGADYTFIATKQSQGWEYRNRSNLELTAFYKPNAQWKLSLRERFRVTSANKEIDSRIEINPSWIMRSRLMAEYSLPCLPLTPYTFFELSNTLNTPDILGNYIDKIRISIGMKYTLSRHSEFDLFYRFDHNRNKKVTFPTNSMPWIVTTMKQNNHIIGFFYEYSF